MLRIVLSAASASIFFLLFLPFSVTGQGDPGIRSTLVDRGVFKWVPKQMESVPGWAALMYSGTDDFEAVVDQRSAWWRERP